MKTLAVSIHQLERHFGDFIAVNRISLDVYEGEIFGFLGPNGAGKSTTIRMLCGLLEPSGGTGTVAGFDLHHQREKIKAVIGYMSQKFSLYDDLSVEQNIDFYSGIYNVPKSRKRDRKDWVLSMAGLEEHRAIRTGALPAGWKQRLSLGCALLHEPRILFLDEPTSGVDPSSRRSFWELIHTLASEGVTVFVTTHYMEEAEYCDRLALIYRGELVALGTPAELKEKFVEEDVLAIACDRPQDALEQICCIPGVRDAALFGQDIHVMVQDADQKGKEIRDHLESLGFCIRTIGLVQPSLEDVFISLIESRDRRDGAQKEFQQ